MAEDNNNNATQITADEAVRPFGELIAKAARGLGANPVLLVPPVLFACVSTAIYALPLWKLHSVVMAGLGGAAGGDVNVLRLGVQFLRALFNVQSVLLIGAAIVARVVLGAVHQAGWCGMFEAAARGGGVASMAGYVRGLNAHSGRFIGAAAMKLSVHAIPALILVLLGPAAGLVPLDKLVLALPFVLAVEGAISLVFLMWRPGCVLEELGAGASLSAGAGYAFGCFGDTLAVCVMWGLYNLLPLVLLAGSAKAFIAGPLLSKGGIEAMAAGLPMMFCAAAVSWMLYIFGAAFFSLLTFVLYDDRVEAIPVEEPAA